MTDLAQVTVHVEDTDDVNVQLNEVERIYTEEPYPDLLALYNLNKIGE